MAPAVPYYAIPVDYTFSTSSLPLPRRRAAVRASTGAVAYTARAAASSRGAIALLDPVGLPVISAVRLPDGSWEGFSGGRLDPRRLLFTARRNRRSPFDVEMDVQMPFQSLRMKGNPTHRCCTLYSGDSVAAKSSLLYKLRKVVYSTRKFRLTVYSGFDHATAIVLLVIFLWGGGKPPCC